MNRAERRKALSKHRARYTRLRRPFTSTGEPELSSIKGCFGRNPLKKTKPEA
jgi:hypothetical protein